MSSDHSVSFWILDLKRGDQSAAAALWNRYFTQLVRYARSELRGTEKRVSDEEDVALSAFESFCQAAQRGRFPDLSDREGLWRLLLGMTARKAVDLRRHNSRKKRGGGSKTVTAADLPPGDDELGMVIGSEPTPEFAAIMAEEFQRLLRCLDDSKLRQLVLEKMEGYTNRELAQRFDCSERTIDRRLLLIRKKLVAESLHE